MKQKRKLTLHQMVATARAAGMDMSLKLVPNHVEVPVKVTAWVDEGIAPLVEAMNVFPLVITTDSCQDNGGFGYVTFSYRGSLVQFVDFTRSLSIGLRRLVPEGGYRIALQWFDGGEIPLGTLMVRPKALRMVWSAVRRLAEEERFKKS